MVQHVVLFYAFPDLSFKVKMVDSVMRYIIKQITQYKARKEPKDVVGRQYGIKQKVKAGSQRNAY